VELKPIVQESSLNESVSVPALNPAKSVFDIPNKSGLRDADIIPVELQDRFMQAELAKVHLSNAIVSYHIIPYGK